jgi:hypothetical protein
MRESWTFVTDCRYRWAMNHENGLLRKLPRCASAIIFCVFLCGLQADAAELRDGQHDFDFEIGTWKTHLKRLLHPLSGSTAWAEYQGTTAVKKVWGGRANLVELEADGPNGHIEALSLRLYNPSAHQWSLNFANSAGGALGIPTVGEFKDDRGEFYDQETLGARALLVRFVIVKVSPAITHFEQSFPDDGGKTWEVNWIADDTRSD